MERLIAGAEAGAMSEAGAEAESGSVARPWLGAWKEAWSWEGALNLSMDRRSGEVGEREDEGELQGDSLELVLCLLAHV